MTRPDKDRKRIEWVKMTLGMLTAITVVFLVVTVIRLIPRIERYYTDADAIRVHQDQVKPRDILWQPAKELSELINTGADDYEPRLSADGTTLYFVRGKAGQNADIYLTTRTVDGWTKPQPLSELNSDFEELGPEPSADGRALYFYSDRPGGVGGYDLWVAHRGETGWLDPVNLGPKVNSEFNDYGPALSPDGEVLYFASNRSRPEDEVQPDPGAWSATLREDLFQRNYDLYAATVTEAGVSEAKPLDRLNTPFNEGAPAVSSFGDFLYFSSDRPGGHGAFDLYRIRRHAPEAMPPENLGPVVNTPANELDPGLSLGGYALYFSSDRKTPADIAEPTRTATGETPRSYDLFYTTSREVFTEIERLEHRPIDWAAIWRAIGPNLLWLLLALLLLLAMWVLMREGMGRRLSLLAKCLLASVAAHLLLLILFNAWQVTASIAREFRRRGPIQIALASPAIQNELTRQVRGNITDVPEPEATQVADARADMAPAQPAESQPVDFEVEMTRPDQPAEPQLEMQVTDAATRSFEAPAGETPEPDAATADARPRLPEDAVKSSTQEAQPTRPREAQPAARRSRVDVEVMADARPFQETRTAAQVNLQAQDESLARLADAGQAQPEFLAEPTDVEATPTDLSRTADIELPRNRNARVATAEAVSTVTPRETADNRSTFEHEPRVRSERTAFTPEPLDAVPAHPLPARPADAADSPLEPAVSVSDPRETGSAPAMTPTALTLGTMETRTLTSRDEPALQGPASRADTLPASAAPLENRAIDPAAIVQVSPGRTADTIAAKEALHVPGEAVEAPLRRSAESAVPGEPAVLGANNLELDALETSQLAVVEPAARPGVNPTLTDITRAASEVSFDAAPRSELSASLAPEKTGWTDTAPSVAKSITADDTAIPHASPELPPLDRASLPKLATTKLALNAPQAAQRARAASEPTKPALTPAIAPGSTRRADVSARPVQAPGQTREFAPPSVRTDVTADSVARGGAPADSRPVPLRADLGTSSAEPSLPWMANLDLDLPATRAGMSRLDEPARANLPTAYTPLSARAPTRMVTADGATQRPVRLDPGAVAGRIAPAVVADAPSDEPVDSPVRPVDLTGTGIADAPPSLPPVPDLSLEELEQAALATATEAEADRARPEWNDTRLALALPDGSATTTYWTQPESPGGVHLSATPRLPRAPMTDFAPTPVELDLAVPSSTEHLPAARHVPLEIELPDDQQSPANPYAQRMADDRMTLVQRMGGSHDTERAVARALEWLARHQDSDGRWDADGFDADCGDCGGETDITADRALTGLALLSFYGAGHTHTTPGPYRKNIERGLNWLLKQWQRDGDFRGEETMYTQGIVTIALSEAYGMSRDARLRAPMRDAVLFIDAARNKEDGGWRYDPGQPGDTSVLGWQIMALNSVSMNGIAVPAGSFKAAREWLDRVSDRRRPGLYAYQPHDGPSESMTAEGMFVQQLLGLPREDPRMRESAEYISEHPPDWENANTYFWYYATLALFQYQGPLWESWNAALTTELVENQRTDGGAAGSWDPVGAWADRGGRVYQTALCTLMLEVYYRYLPMYTLDGSIDPIGAIRGIVTDATSGDALGGVQIRLDLTGQQAITVETGPDGSYHLLAPQVPDHFALTASRKHYQPSTANVESARLEGKTLAVDFNLWPETERIVVLEEDPEVHHLGDNRFEGRINSQFQKESEGAWYGRTFQLSATQLNPSINLAKVTLMAKGVQRSHRIRINGVDLPDRLDDAPSDGSFGEFESEFDPAILSLGENKLEIIAKPSDTDIDDFEFVNVQIRLIAER